MRRRGCETIVQGNVGGEIIETFFTIECSGANVRLWLINTAYRHTWMVANARMRLP